MQIVRRRAYCEGGGEYGRHRKTDDANDHEEVE